jgi:FtsH-binding integral membrane protein
MKDKSNDIQINPVTQKAHQQQMLWQVTGPFILGLIIFLVFIVLIIITGVQGDPRIFQWGDVSLIWLILPTMLFLLIMIVIFGGLLYLIMRLNKALPGFMKRTQVFFEGMHDLAEKAADLAVEPVIKTEASRAALRTLFRRGRNQSR